MLRHTINRRQRPSTTTNFTQKTLRMDLVKTSHSWLFFSFLVNILLITCSLIQSSTSTLTTPQHAAQVEKEIRKVAPLHENPKPGFPARDDKTGSDMFGQTTKQILRLRGFDAIEYNVTVNNDFTLNLVRIINPFTKANTSEGALISKKPILFVHGVLASANWFLLNSIDARPKNLTNLLHAEPEARSLPNLMRLLAKDPTSKCLPMLMSNFGYDIWLLNRRPTLESQVASNRPVITDSNAKYNNRTKFERTRIYIAIHKAILSFLISPLRRILTTIKHISSMSPFKTSVLRTTGGVELLLNEVAYNLETLLMPNVFQKTINAGYWHFSLDEQARFDIPKVIDYILDKTGRTQLDIVGHSLGGALPLMTLSSQPEYQSKVAHCFLFAPAVDLGRTHLIGPGGARDLENLLQAFNGPVVPGIFMPIFQTFAANLCTNKLIQRYLCAKYINLVIGKGTAQLEMHPGTYFFGPTTSSSHELVQLAQSIEKRHLHHYDYRNVEQNMIAYNQSTPPRYEMGNIKKTHLFIWDGNTDLSVTPETIKILLNSLKSPYNYTLVNETGVEFNHMAYQFHKKVATIINIPLIHTLDSLQ